MKAVILRATGKPEVLKVTDAPVPQVRPGWVLLKVKAFGINRSELMMREYEADASYMQLPRIMGIECAGEVEDPSDSNLKKGQKVVALMGGMGRSFDGSYAEFTLVPTRNIFTVDTNLPWEEIGAIPETWFTAYGSLFDSLVLKTGETLLIRGGTSAAGLTAIQLGKSIGATVLASTRNKSKRDFLKQQGADYILIDDGSLPKQLFKLYPKGVDKILELIGASTLRESLKLATHQGIVCNTGILGKKGTLDHFDPIKDIPIGVYLTSFFSNYPTKQAIDGIFSLIKKYNLHPVIAKVFSLKEIAEAHQFAESNQANGKIVIIN